MFRKLLEKLRGSSRAPEDLALGTTRPGDFAEEPDIEPNPHEREETPRAETDPGRPT